MPGLLGKQCRSVALGLMKRSKDLMLTKMWRKVEVTQYQRWTWTLTRYAVEAMCASSSRSNALPKIRLTYETNVFSIMRMCQKFAPLLMNSKGTIVQIGSVAGVMPYVFGSVYNSSKAALHSYSNTLRVELAPFDVRVVTIVTGGVKSNIARTHRELPGDSIYLPVQKEYEERLVHSQTSSSIPNEKYAATVVKQVLGRPSNHVWAGGRSFLVWFVR